MCPLRRHVIIAELICLVAEHFSLHIYYQFLWEAAVYKLFGPHSTVSLHKYLCLEKFHSDLADLQRAKKCLSLLFSCLSFSGKLGSTPSSLKGSVVLSSTAAAAWKHLQAVWTPIVRIVRGKKGRSHFSSIYSTIRGYSKKQDHQTNNTDDTCLYMGFMCLKCKAAGFFWHSLLKSFSCHSGYKKR